MVTREKTTKENKAELGGQSSTVFVLRWVSTGLNVSQGRSVIENGHVRDGDEGHRGSLRTVCKDFTVNPRVLKSR